MKKCIPIGISDYKELIDANCYYVDKTLLVNDVLKSGKVVLVTRPRRFGKTLNMSMLRYFFEQSLEDREYLFSAAAIWKDAQAKASFGQFPVIFLTFKGVKASRWEVCYDRFALTIYEEFDRHRFLLETALEPEEIKLYRRILEREASEAELGSSLHFLAKLLERYYKKKVVVIIDEYDVPIQSAFVHGFYQEAIDFSKSLLTAILKDNNLLEKGIVTGILTLAKAGIFTDLNNLDVFNLTHARMADKFGFTPQEVEQLLNYYDLANKKEEIKAWYDGYAFGMTAEIYNPWSVLKCTNDQGILEMYWANTSDNVLIKKLITRASASLKSELEIILANKTVRQPIVETIIFPDLDHRSDLIWSLLLFTGYLTYQNYEMEKGKKVCSLMIPNQEIRYLYIDMLNNIFKDAIIGGEVSDLLLAITEGDTYTFTKLLQSFVLSSMSVYDLPSNEPEKSYHLFVLGLLVALSDSYEVKSNRESGFGRYDIMLIPKKEHKPAVVMEFKIVRPGETLEAAAQKALEQIRAKKYAQELHAKSVSSVVEYGIAFEGKNVFVLSGAEEKNV